MTLKTPVIYPVAALKESKNKDAADKFVKFLQSEKSIKKSSDLMDLQLIN